MQYPVFIHKDTNSDYGIIVPDLSGCYFTGSTKISGKAKRINITLPERFLKQIDKYTKQHGINRSAFLVDAALSFMAAH